jgi:hypothetical protein
MFRLLLSTVYIILFMMPMHNGMETIKLIYNIYTQLLYRLMFCDKRYLLRIIVSAIDQPLSGQFHTIFVLKLATILDSWPLKMRPTGCPETSLRNYHFSLYSSSYESSSYLLRVGILKSLE